MPEIMATDEQVSRLLHGGDIELMGDVPVVVPHERVHGSAEMNLVQIFLGAGIEARVERQGYSPGTHDPDIVGKLRIQSGL